MTATYVDVFHTVTGKTVLVMTTNGKRRALCSETWTHGKPALMDVTRFSIDTALTRASRRTRKIGPKAVLPALNLTLSNGHSLKELVARREHFVHVVGDGFIVVKHDNPDARLNVVVFGRDSDSPWSTCTAPCAASGPIAEYRLVNDTLTVVPIGKPTVRVYSMWILDLATGMQLVGPRGTKAPSGDLVSASA